jgi:uncharacterized protein with von Willebrand factor type A (vWA) domain
MGIRDISNSGGARCSALLTPISESTIVVETETESATVTAIVVDGSCTTGTESVLPRQAPPVMLVVAAASALVHHLCCTLHVKQQIRMPLWHPSQRRKDASRL